MGIESFSKWVSDVLGKYFKDFTLPLNSIHNVVTFVAEDSEASMFITNAGADEFSELLERNAARLTTALEVFPEMKEMKFIFDSVLSFGSKRCMAKEVKRLIREAKSAGKSIVDIDESHLPMLKLEGCAGATPEQIKEREVMFEKTRLENYGDVPSFKSFIQSMLRNTDLRADMRVYFAKSIVALAAEKGFRASVLNVREAQADNSSKYFDFHSEGETKRPAKPRASEAEMEIIGEVVRLLRSDPDAVPLARTTDSDCLAIALLLSNLIPEGRRWYLEIGTTVYDVPALYRSITDWGVEKGIVDPVSCFLTTAVMCGSDYVKKIGGLGTDGVITRALAFGFEGQTISRGLFNDPKQHEKVADWINESALERYILAFCATRPRPRRAATNDGPPKKKTKAAPNPRFDRFESVKDGTLLTSQLALDIIALDPQNRQNTYVQVPEEERNRLLWLKQFVRQIMWQLAYWRFGPFGNYPNPLEKDASGDWKWGWKRDEDNKISFLL